MRRGGSLQRVLTVRAILGSLATVEGFLGKSMKGRELPRWGGFLMLSLMGDFAGASRELDLVDHLRIGDEGRWRTEYHRGLIAEAQEQYLEARSYYMRSRRFNPAFDKAIHRGRWLDGLSSAE